MSCHGPSRVGGEEAEVRGRVSGVLPGPERRKRLIPAPRPAQTAASAGCGGTPLCAWRVRVPTRPPRVDVGGLPSRSLHCLGAFLVDRSVVVGGVVRFGVGSCGFKS